MQTRTRKSLVLLIKLASHLSCDTVISFQAEIKLIWKIFFFDWSSFRYNRLKCRYSKPTEACRHRLQLYNWWGCSWTLMSTAAVAKLMLWVLFLRLFFIESMQCPRATSALLKWLWSANCFKDKLDFHFCLNAFVPVLYFWFYICSFPNKATWDWWLGLDWNIDYLLFAVFAGLPVQFQAAQKSTSKIQLKYICSLTE